MGVYRYLIALILILCGMSVSSARLLFGQSLTEDYALNFRPDVWYNKIDGIRAGGVISGKARHTSAITPLQFTAGGWLGTSLPAEPYSYYFNLKQPLLTGDSFFSNPTYMEITISSRTGFRRYQLRAVRQWSFTSTTATTVKSAFSLQASRRFEKSYLLYPNLWDQKWVTPIQVDLGLNRLVQNGKFDIHLRSTVNLPVEETLFLHSRVKLRRTYNIGDLFAVKSRIFFGYNSSNAPPQYRWLISHPIPQRWMDHSFFRAKGTIPASWSRMGYFQLAGGPHLRGYTNTTFDRLNRGAPVLYRSFGALNMEFNIPNPVNQAIESEPLLNEVMHFRSYLFWDAGRSFFRDANNTNYTKKWLQDAGMGVEWKLSLNDYLNRSHGFFLRYELPLWLSKPLKNQEPFQIRHLIGFGTILNL